MSNLLSSIKKYVGMLYRFDGKTSKLKNCEERATILRDNDEIADLEEKVKSSLITNLILENHRQHQKRSISSEDIWSLLTRYDGSTVKSETYDQQIKTLRNLLEIGTVRDKVNLHLDFVNALEKRRHEQEQQKSA